MLTRDTVFQVSFEGYALLRNVKGDSSEALRRFLARWSHDGTVFQVFSDSRKDLDSTQLTQYGAYAEQVRTTCLDHLRGISAQGSRTSLNAAYSIVQNNFALNCDVDSASLPELRVAVANVLALSDSMHEFATDPLATLNRVADDAISGSQVGLQDTAELQQQSLLDYVLDRLSPSIPDWTEAF